MPDRLDVLTVFLQGKHSNCAFYVDGLQFPGPEYLQDSLMKIKEPDTRVKAHPLFFD